MSDREHPDQARQTTSPDQPTPVETEERVAPADDDRYPADDTVSLLDLLAIIARRWKLIFFTTFFAATGIVLFSLYTIRTPPDSPYNPLPNFYRPEAQILLSDPDSSGGLSSALGGSDLGLLGGLASLGGGQGADSAALAQELLRGNAIITQIVEEFALLDAFAESEAPLASARASIRDSLATEFNGDSGILNVSFQSTDPVFATDVLSRLVTLLESRFTYLTRDDARARTQAIENQLQQLEDDVQRARSALTSFQERYGVINPESQGRETVDLIAQFRRSKFELELEREQIHDLVQDREDPQNQRINQNIRRIEELITELETGYRLYSPISIPLDQVATLTVQYTDLQRDLERPQPVVAIGGLIVVAGQALGAFAHGDQGRVARPIGRACAHLLKLGHPRRSSLRDIGTVDAPCGASGQGWVLHKSGRARGPARVPPHGPRAAPS